VYAIVFPSIDPVIVSFGPFAVRWYALAYIVGILLGWRYVLRLASRAPALFTRQQIDDFIVWATLGIVLGGRLGYVLFYKPGHYLQQPLEALYIWQGGMSFHGGLIGIIAAIILYSRRLGRSPLVLGDLVAAAGPIGLFFGRLANFINAELHGRPSDVPWAVLFPGEALARHPSQIYQAFLEGIALFAVMAWFARDDAWKRRPGLLCGVFLAGYAIARMIGELFREPDAHLGFIVGPLTMGQILSLPMLLVGAALIRHARRPA
jgi:phosphatidylglycerol:prolipoprotein diacylglycerol transferase